MRCPSRRGCELAWGRWVRRGKPWRSSRLRSMTLGVSFVFVERVIVGVD
jgi:hypothetical protein